MIIELKPKKIKDLVQSPVFQQGPLWARVKDRQHWKSKAFRTYIDAPDTYLIDGGYDDHLSPEEERQKVGQTDLLVLIRSIGDNMSMAYIPYGPRFEPGEENRGRCLEVLSESLRPFLPDNCLFIRYDLLWQSLWTGDKNQYDDKGKWLGPPSSEICELRMNFDTLNWKLRKAPTGILPSNTMLLNLDHEKGFLLKNMKAKTRYNIRLSQRKGVKVREAGMDDFETWYDLYRQTATRNKITLHSPDYFRTILDIQEGGAGSNSQVKLLLASVQDEPLAAMFMAIADKRATYLYGASSSYKRNLMGTYALQWEAMLIASRSGCTEYDMFGVSPFADPAHPMFGLYRFKSGFGGEIFHREGCWDYALDEITYEIYRAKEMVADGYHL